ncbi:hypothetical protein ACB098_05G167700 [Castanea mollissima]
MNKKHINMKHLLNCHIRLIKNIPTKKKKGSSMKYKCQFQQILELPKRTYLLEYLLKVSMHAYTHAHTLNNYYISLKQHDTCKFKHKMFLLFPHTYTKVSTQANTHILNNYYTSPKQHYTSKLMMKCF